MGQKKVVRVVEESDDESEEEEEGEDIQRRREDPQDLIVKDYLRNRKFNSKKSLRKQQKRELKERKKKQREYENFLYEEKVKKKQRKQEEYFKLRKNEEEEKEKQKKQEKDEEYDEWAHLFEVEKSGFSKKKARESNINDFVEMIKKEKTIMLEDLSMKFSMSVNDVIKRIKDLETQEILAGVMDRGKYIYLSEMELNEVVKYVEKEGRVTVEKIQEHLNKIINKEE